MDRSAGRAAARERRFGIGLDWGIVLPMLALTIAGCTTNGTSSPLASGRGTTVAFESIDGPPPAIFHKLVQKLNHEAQVQRVPVVSRETLTPYRVRGYVAVGIEKKKHTLISWVWDVYDAQERRSLRIAGEERAGLIGRDAWASANDDILNRIARKAMGQLADYLRSPDARPAGYQGETPRDSDERGAVLASADDFRPEASGIFRLFKNDEGPARRPPLEMEAAATPSTDVPTGFDVPLPRRRPARIGTMAHDRVAFADSALEPVEKTQTPR